MAFDFSADTKKNYLQTVNQNAPDAGAALKVLSLNLPNFVGGSPIAPDALLRPGLSTAAQVGGTAPAPPPPVATPSPALAGLSAQLGTPDQGPPPGGTPLVSAPGLSSPTAASGQSPFASSTAPIASMASGLLGVNNFTPPSAPASPYFETGGLPRAPGGDVYGGGQAPLPTPTPPQTGNSGDALAQILMSLFQGTGGTSAPDRPEHQQI